MKTTLVRLGLIGAVMLVSLGGTAALAGPQAQQEAVLGAVNVIQANLYMTGADASEETLISRPTIFDVGEKLRTDETGVALITWFYDGTESVLGQNSELTLKNFSGEASTSFVISLSLDKGRLVGGMGIVADMAHAGTWTVSTPAFTFSLLSGRFDLTVADDGTTTLVITEGRAEILLDGDEPLRVSANQFFVASPDDVPDRGTTLSDDGMTTALSGVCTATTSTNINVRVAPNEDSLRLGGVPAEQTLWVLAGTEGNLWLQVYYQTAEDDAEAHNYGWVYGPAVELDEDACTTLLHATLDAHLYGGPGIDKAVAD